MWIHFYICTYTVYVYTHTVKVYVYTHVHVQVLLCMYMYLFSKHMTIDLLQCVIIYDGLSISKNVY